MDENNNQVNYGGVNYGPDPVNPGANPNQQPPVYNAASGATTEKNGMCTAAMICGIVGIILSCCGCGWLLPIVAIILGAIGKGKATNEADAKNAKVGLICGIVGVVISIIVTITYIILYANGAMTTYYYNY